MKMKKNLTYKNNKTKKGKNYENFKKDYKQKNFFNGTLFIKKTCLQQATFIFS